MDVDGGRYGPWMWREVGMDHGCGWGRNGPWMWMEVGTDHGCGWR